MLAASSSLLAQNAALPNGSQSPSSVPDVGQIVASSVAATQRHWREWVLSSYLERDETRHLDSAGHIKSEEVDVSRAFLGMVFSSSNSWSATGARSLPKRSGTSRRKLNKLKRLTPEQRAERLRKEEQENTLLVGEVPMAFDFQLAGEDVVDGRPAWVLQAAPHPGYQAQGPYGKMFSKVAGRLWVDKQDFGWIKVDGYVTQPFSMGLFLARVLRGSHITMEQTRLDEGLWLPGHIEVRADAKILFIKILVIDRVLSYSQYSPPPAGVPGALERAVP